MPTRHSVRRSRLLVADFLLVSITLTAWNKATSSRTALASSSVQHKVIALTWPAQYRRIVVRGSPLLQAFHVRLSGSCCNRFGGVLRATHLSALRGGIKLAWLRHTAVPLCAAKFLLRALSITCTGSGGCLRPSPHPVGSRDGRP